MASIIIISGEEKGEYLLLGRRTNVIGRAENLPMQILDDLVSRKHLRIRYDENTNEHYAEDMDSKHGVFINSRKIIERTALKEGVDHSPFLELCISRYLNIHQVQFWPGG